MPSGWRGKATGCPTGQASQTDSPKPRPWRPCGSPLLPPQPAITPPPPPRLADPLLRPRDPEPGLTPTHLSAHPVGRTFSLCPNVPAACHLHHLSRTSAGASSQVLSLCPPSQLPAWCPQQGQWPREHHAEAQSPRSKVGSAQSRAPKASRPCSSEGPASALQ